MPSISPLQYVQSLGESVIRLGLGRAQKALTSLQNPQNSYPTIHIAGTNGKGSVASMLASIFNAAGYKVGLYTSPHLHKINERFQINGKQVSKAELNKIIPEIRKNASVPLTQFEFLTLIAFCWFQKNDVDLAIVETGLGGRLDATNTIKKPLVSVITNIDFDHVNWLGDSLEKIAYEKAGIIKPGVPVVTGARGKALKVIKKIAHRKKSPIEIVHEYPQLNTGMHLKGFHQIQNASLAIETVRVVQNKYPKINVKKINQGIRNARWPGRFERFGNNWILDGAHNPAAIKTVVTELSRLHRKKVNILFGSMQDKDNQKMIKLLSAITNQCRVVPLNSHRSADPKQIIKFPEWKGRAVAVKSSHEAFAWAKKQNPKIPMLVTGSLYLVGDIRSKLTKIYSEKKKT